MTHTHTVFLGIAYHEFVPQKGPGTAAGIFLSWGDVQGMCHVCSVITSYQERGDIMYGVGYEIWDLAK